jgi:FlaG/FlaF family flagellin (archaellin)
MIKNEYAVSNIIGVVLMVAITTAVATAVFIHFSGILNEEKDYSVSIACITDSSTDRITITSTYPTVKWRDIEIVPDNTSVNWRVYDSSHDFLDMPKSTLNATDDITPGDFIEFDFSDYPGMAGNIRVSLIFIPTNTLLGSWIITV